MSKVATAVIAGLGADGYRAAVEALLRRLDAPR
jgi:3-dehydroquinate dehydratase